MRTISPKIHHHLWTRIVWFGKLTAHREGEFRVALHGGEPTTNHLVDGNRVHQPRVTNEVQDLSRVKVHPK